MATESIEISVHELVYIVHRDRIRMHGCQRLFKRYLRNSARSFHSALSGPLVLRPELRLMLINLFEKILKDDSKRRLCCVRRVPGGHLARGKTKIQRSGETNLWT